MSLLDELSRPECWERFYEYKCGLAVPKSFLKELRAFIDRQGYRRVCDAIAAGERFPLPEKSVISKMGSRKKRVVYTYPTEENTVLKLLTWLLLRRYDGVFSGNLYSFRPGRTAKDAVMRLVRTPGVRGLYAYKADVSDYFNSASVPLLLRLLAPVLADDPALFAFLRALLEEPEVIDRGNAITEQKGMMAGTPLSAFYANLYLRELDRLFWETKTPYARYSDDIIVFAPDRETLAAHAGTVRSFITERSLTLNPEKEELFTPDDGWVFLGFRYRNGEIDLAPASVTKMKQKMRRKARALRRWALREELSPEKAARAFIRIFNRKLFEHGADNELTWALWYFPVITTDKSLHALDAYAQEQLRYLMSGRHTKARYNVRYGDLKKLGYRCLVHEYYAFRKAAAETATPETK